MTGPLSQAVALSRAVAQGDLSGAPIAHGTNEVGQLLEALQQMRAQLTQVVRNVRSGSESVATASVQIAQGNTDLSARTESQASALEETAASMEQLNATVRQNADNARQANQLAMSASTVAGQGGDVVAEEGDVATLNLTRSTQEVRLGDRLFPTEERAVNSTFMPGEPSREVKGEIIDVPRGVTQIGQFDVVTLNRGQRDGLAEGNVLAIYKVGETVRDRSGREIGWISASQCAPVSDSTWRASPGGGTAWRPICTSRSVLVKLPVFSGKALAGRITSARYAVSVRKMSCTTRWSSAASASRAWVASGSDMAGFSPCTYMPRISPCLMACITSTTVSPG